MRLNTTVQTLLYRQGNEYVVQTGDTRFETDHVVVTTGPLSDGANARVGRASLDRRIVQIHSNAYQNPTQLPSGDVLVVGAGNTGAEWRSKWPRLVALWRVLLERPRRRSRCRR